ncbi:MAG: SCO family protein [Dechloromonas sp.]|nr:SCO family protein [Dechloromonas sp.]
MFKLKTTATVSLLAIALGAAGAAGAADDHAGHHHHHGSAASAAAPAVDEHAHHRAPAPAEPPQSVRLKLPDSALIDQDGRTQRLVSEVMGDKVIVASFVYTSCTTICPVVSTLFSQVQDKLGGLLDQQVRLLSLSVDPARDTPARLKSYAESHGARPGWLWLTGQQPDVTAALKGFGTYTANFKDHPVVIMIGDGKSGQWVRYYGFQDPERLAAQVREVLAARRPAVVVTARKD